MLEVTIMVEAQPHITAESSVVRVGYPVHGICIMTVQDGVCQTQLEEVTMHVAMLKQAAIHHAQET